MLNIKTLDHAFLFIRNGKSLKQSSESSGVPITRIETIADKSIDIERLGYADIDINELEKFENYLLQEGDILMSHINSLKHLGKTAIYQNKPKYLIHGMNLLCLRVKKEICDAGYANYFFQSTHFNQDLMKISNKSVNQASFSVGRLKDLKIPLPPLKTQQKIASILDDAAALRDKTAQLLKEYDLLAQSIFLDMFGDLVNNQKKWEKVKFQEIFTSIRYGTSSPPIYQDHGIPFIRATNVKNGYIEEKGLVHISEEEANKIEKCRLKEGDLIIVRSGANTGDCSRIPKEYVNAFGGFDIIIEIKEPQSTFANFLLNTKAAKAVLGPLTRRAGQPHINSKQLSELELISPPIKLQSQFADKIALIERQKELAKQELKESEDLFNCLLQKACKGELL